MWQGLESFLMISAGQRCYWHLVDRGQVRRLLNHHKVGSCPQHQLSNMAKMLRLRDPVLGLKAPGGGERVWYLPFP